MSANVSVNLNDLLPEVEEISIGRGKVKVYGIDVTQAGVLIAKYRSGVEIMFSGAEPNFNALASQLPEMVTEIIAMGIRAENQIEEVERIPLSAQLEILSAIWKASVLDPKKLLAKLKEVADEVKGLRP